MKYPYCGGWHGARLHLLWVMFEGLLQLKLTGLILVEHGSSWWRLVTGADDPIFRRQTSTSSLCPPFVRHMVLSCQLCLAVLIANQLLYKCSLQKTFWVTLFVNLVFIYALPGWLLLENWTSIWNVVVLCGKPGTW